MITVLIGHRGTGKTALLRRLPGYLQGRGGGAHIFDLDQEIVARERRSIDEILQKGGEPEFRKIEASVFERLVDEAEKRPEQTFICLGAGFGGEVPARARRLWVRRPSDGAGRVFLDRPRLNREVSAFEEYLERFSARERGYHRLATDIWCPGEGFDRGDPVEESRVLNLFSEEELEVGGALSLLPWNFRAEGEGFEAWIGRRLRWRGTRFEIRDDLLAPDEIARAFAAIPSERLIYGFRRPGPRPWEPAEIAARGLAWDWPLELGARPPAAPGPSILSLHERKPDETVSGAAARLEGFDPCGSSLLKLAVEARSFDELREGHLWAQGRPGLRSFLPRSGPDRPGRWSWYRAWMIGRSPIQFVREGDGTSLDQPTLAEWLRVRRVAARGGEFAAILGDPVVHSRTPAEQGHFFSERGMPTLAIALSEAEWEAGAIGVLAGLGLRCAAVTSPLKRKAFELCAPGAREDFGLGAINTLIRDPATGRWGGRNTDVVGFLALHSLVPELGAGAETVVWGGGGTLDVVRGVLPEARAFSARTGLARPGEAALTRSPRALIWAVGRARSAPHAWPPEDWKPAVAVDLNYSEDSPGREYAIRCGARYVSGLEMFRAQARAQREFWKTGIPG